MTPEMTPEMIPEEQPKMITKMISGSFTPKPVSVSLEKAVELSLNAERMIEQRMGAAIEWAFQQVMKGDGPISELKTQILSMFSHLMRCSREYSKFQTLAVIANEFEDVKKKYETIEVMDMLKTMNVTVDGKANGTDKKEDKENVSEQKSV